MLVNRVLLDDLEQNHGITEFYTSSSAYSLYWQEVYDFFISVGDSPMHFYVQASEEEQALEAVAETAVELGFSGLVAEDPWEAQWITEEDFQLEREDLETSHPGASEEYLRGIYLEEQNFMSIGDVFFRDPPVILKREKIRG